MSHANTIKLRSRLTEPLEQAQSPSEAQSPSPSETQSPNRTRSAGETQAQSAEQAAAKLVSAPLQAVTALQLPSCATAKLVAVNSESLVLEAGGKRFEAQRDASVHPAVLDGALNRGERVLAECRGEDGWFVVGALHTQPVPGIDRSEKFLIEADEIELKAAREVSMSAQAATVVVRALGEVETYAERIVSRAEGLHKIVGRMLNLN